MNSFYQNCPAGWQLSSEFASAPAFFAGRAVARREGFGRGTQFRTSNRHGSFLPAT
jgi:hypothetical protein